MDTWGIGHRVMFTGQQEENRGQLSSSVKMEEDFKDEDEDEDEETIKSEAFCIPEFKKRKRLSLSQLREVKAGLGGMQKQSFGKLKIKRYEKSKDRWYEQAEQSMQEVLKAEGATFEKRHVKQSCGKLKIKRNEKSKDRWSAERYELAEQSMWEVLKAEGATFENPISRPALRLAARKHIGDTGLLDHLLKHIDGRVAPGGTERFRRWFNTKGIMEYWLESADLVKVRLEAGVQDPYWLPSGQDIVLPQNSEASNELKLLQTEMAQMKRDMQELISRREEKNEMNLMEEMHKEMVRWKTMTEQRLTEITTSLMGMQGMYSELATWKSKFEHQLGEITNKLSDLQASKERTTFSPPPARWEDWLESTNLDNIQGDELLPWFGSTELLNVEQGVVLQDPNSALPTHLLNGELTTVKSDMLEVLPKKQEEDQPNVTPDSSTTTNSNLDLDNSLILFQEMFMELFKWKDKMEQQMLELSNTVYGTLGMK